MENTPIVNYREVHSRVEGVVRLPYFEALPKVALSYGKQHQQWQWQSHLSVAEGYKAGGFNTQLFSDILQNTMMQDMMQDMGVSFASGSDYTVSEVIAYHPERCLNFEVGIEGVWKQNEWQLNGQLTAYELEVFNQQLTIFPEHGTGRLMTNAGHSRSAGAEASAQIRWKNLTLQTNYGYTYAVFVSYNNGKEDFAGKHVPYSPEHTIAASLTYAVPLKHTFFHTLALNLNTQAYGKIFWEETNKEYQPLYALLNANITLNMKYISLSLWGKNLTQTRYDVFRYVSMGNVFMQSGKPLTFGAKLMLEI